MIPLFHVEENKLTSLNGEVSTFFEILGLILKDWIQVP